MLTRRKRKQRDRLNEKTERLSLDVIVGLRTLQVQVRFDGGVTNCKLKTLSMQIKYKKLSDKAVEPIRATQGSAGYDLVATNITTEINEVGQLILVYHTDLAFEIPEGYEGEIRPRSSISRKSLRMCNAPGTVDSDYRGEVIVKFISTTDVVPAVYKVGERFAQLLIKPVITVDFVQDDELSTTARGEKGYGSTGTEDISAAKENQSLSENKDESINSESSNQQAAGSEDVASQQPEQV